MTLLLRILGTTCLASVLLVPLASPETELGTLAAIVGILGLGIVGAGCFVLADLLDPRRRRERQTWRYLEESRERRWMGRSLR